MLSDIADYAATKLLGVREAQVLPDALRSSSICWRTAEEGNRVHNSCKSSTA